MMYTQLWKFQKYGILKVVIYYDEISSGLLVSEIRRKRQELLESLSLFYRVFILKEDISDMLEE